MVLTGEGKGKTTSAAGQALRYLGARKKILFIQFFKKGNSSETVILKKLGVSVLADKKAELPVNLDDPETILRQSQLLKTALEISGQFNVFILDEFNLFASSKLANKKVLKTFLNELLQQGDVIVTGRNAPRWLIIMADTVSRIINVKHHYEKGIGAKKGREY